jgi:general secretion pathway protein B
MSYILDALKRADAERERGQVPGLHSQSRSAASPLPSEPAPGPSGRALLAGACALLLLVAAATWWWLSPPQAAPVQASAVSMPVPPPGPQPVPPETAQAAPLPQPTGPALPILAPEPVVARPAPEAAPAVARAGSAAPGPATPTAANASPTGPVTAPANDNVRSFAELPPEVRAQLPQVNVSGSTYSSNPSHRMLIVNGKVLQEGEDIAPGLKLETIGPGKAVLNHNGTRYSIGF